MHARTHIHTHTYTRGWKLVMNMVLSNWSDPLTSILLALSAFLFFYCCTSAVWSQMLSFSYCQFVVVLPFCTSAVWSQMLSTSFCSVCGSLAFLHLSCLSQMLSPSFCLLSSPLFATFGGLLIPLLQHNACWCECVRMLHWIPPISVGGIGTEACMSMVVCPWIMCWTVHETFYGIYTTYFM